nr:hypothetical protein C1892_12660 [Pseudomonas sp. MPBD7-1]
MVARELAPAGLRSGPSISKATTASQPSGSKLPRHGIAALYPQSQTFFDSITFQQVRIAGTQTAWSVCARPSVFPE